MIRRIFQAPKQSYFLFGPRGTGKSTWVRQHYPEALYIDLLAPDAFRRYHATPEYLSQILSARHDAKTIIIDEIQKAPQLLDVVHQLIETYPDVQFILTGSSARKLKRGGVDLLAGRALSKALHPFMAVELGDHFSLETALTRGMVPLVLNAPLPAETLESYIGLYLKEEVQNEGLVRRIGDFGRFIEAASFSQGAQLNVSDVARDCQVQRKAAEAYFGILEDLLLAFQLPVFTRRARRQLQSHPKFFFFDAGVFRTIRPAGPLDAPAEIDGAALEGLVAQHLRSWCAYRQVPCDLYFWRTRAGLEVDFILYGKDTFCAIEVKNTAVIRSRMLNGLTAFKEEYPEAQTCFLYRGQDRVHVKDVLCMPVADFLMQLHPHRAVLADDDLP
ncbi:MAG: AAA family ATPase [Desulfatitalea sp.]